jgi:hypothetical protein
MFGLLLLPEEAAMDADHTAMESGANSYRLWNEFIQAIAGSYEALSVVQRPAHLVFVYESEVQNGGHLQYFENAGVQRLDGTISALKLLGATCQAGVLSESSRVFLGRARKGITNKEEYVAAALGGDFDQFDESFHACSPALIECLDRYLQTHLSSFFPVT